MADTNRFSNENGCKQAVCVDAGRVYDSCSDKDCLEDLRVYFIERDQMVVDHAISVRAKSAEVITTYIDVEALPFNRGYYSCDLTFFFEIKVEAFCGRNIPSTVVNGIGIFSKKVILYGSEGNVQVFSSEYRENRCDPQEMPRRNMPRCVVQVAEPVVLGTKLVQVCDCPCECNCSIPESVLSRYGAPFVDNAEGKAVLVTLGIFSIVQLVRNVQMLVPVYDFCMPERECVPTSDNPCDLFKKMCFPVDDFFPPQHEGCSCSGRS